MKAHNDFDARINYDSQGAYLARQIKLTSLKCYVCCKHEELKITMFRKVKIQSAALIDSLQNLAPLKKQKKKPSIDMFLSATAKIKAHGYWNILTTPTLLSINNY